jgi:MtrB/PioB family decaheme-associated outer membrane protein
MSRTALRRSTPVALAVATALGLGVARAETPLPDTSEWKCSQCPFLEGYSASVEAGAEYANGADARYGKYTGVDHNGAYAAVGASGQWRDASGTFVRYGLDSVGLPSRQGYVEGGREGQFDVRVGYDGQPARLYDTTPVKIESDRRTVSLLGQFFSSKDWTVYADVSHQEKVGTGLTSGSFLTEATQLPQPIDYVTNTVETGVRWTSRIASLRLAYTGSWFKDDTDALSWQNPYPPVVPGATRGQLALPPGNDLQQVLVAGDLRLPIFVATTLTYEASFGRLRQDQAFLPVSTLSGTAALAEGSLDGDIHVSHYGLALSSRPLARLYLRGKASYDGRDEHTRALAIPYVVTDTFPGGTYITPRYGEDRTRLDGSADYRLFHWLRVGVGGEALYVHYSPGQVVTSTQNNRGWGQVTVNPLTALTFTARAGNARRKTAIFNSAALPASESPLLRAYNYAPRDQNFFSLSSSWAVTPSLTWGLEGAWADDAYRLSPLGLQSGRDRRLATTLTWVPVERLSLYLDSSYQRLAAVQRGAIAATAPDWRILDGQYYWSGGAGAHWQIRERWDFGVDYLRATTRGDTNIVSGGALAPQFFPENRTRLDSIALNTTWKWSKALKIRLRYAHERYDSSDWALDNVGPSTIGNFLSLGELPYRYAVNVFALTAVYDLGERDVVPKE